MSFKNADRVEETSTTTGTGTYTLDGASTGRQSFVAGVGANNYCGYVATDDTNWEVGVGQVLTGPNRLTRDKVKASSNGGAAVNWGSGTRKLRCVLLAEFGAPRSVTKSVAGGVDVTLTQDEQRCDILILTGALTAPISVILDATPWEWTVFNNTTGDYGLTLKVTGQTGISIPRGHRDIVHCDGTDVRRSFEFSRGKNVIINGAFNIWQRGTSFAADLVYTADRWKKFRETGAVGITVSKQAHGITALGGSGIRVQRDSGNVNTSNSWIVQALESQDSVPLQGKTVTLSFWAKKGANYSASADALVSYIATGTGTDQAPEAVWTGNVEDTKSHTLTGSYQRFVHTYTLPANGNQIKVGFRSTPVGTAGADDWFEVAGVQLEIGSVATDFDSRPTQQEMVLCQRYYRTDGGGRTGYMQDASVIAFVGHLVPNMRVSPTIALIDATIIIRYPGAADLTSSGSTIQYSTTAASGWHAGITGFSGLTEGKAAVERVGEDFVSLSAEL